ncbi:MAG: transporter ATP-binding protein [Bacteroidetes bacterium]|nr:transporter ATP-binding protein [Bacteroidota bacterium]
MPTAIKFENISKQYRLGLVSTRTLSHDLNRWWQMNILRKEDPYLKIGEVNDRAHKGSSEYVWALKDINFEVEQGDVVGIIGKNGAGKSTLLKILSKVTTPTTGTIKAKGRIASLLEVGTGFHPEMTGKENIYMNGAIMGMTRNDINRKFDEIVDFAGVERYIDTPVKRYSSGMTVRLGFAVAAFLEPEILVVDEVLAVGDAEFQKKAIGKMQDVSRGDGRTVLFVSHNMGSIASLCNKGVFFNKGSIAYIGDINDTISLYISEGARESVILGKNPHNDIYLQEIRIINMQGKTTNNIAYNEKVGIKFELGINKFISNATLSFILYDAKLNPITTSHYALSFKSKTITAYLPAQFLLAGNYYLKPVLHIPNVRFLDICDDYLSFRIEDSGSIYSIYNRSEFGFVNINTLWSENS